MSIQIKDLMPCFMTGHSLCYLCSTVITVTNLSSPGLVAFSFLLAMTGTSCWEYNPEKWQTTAV